MMSEIADADQYLRGLQNKNIPPEEPGFWGPVNHSGQFFQRNRVLEHVVFGILLAPSLGLYPPHRGCQLSTPTA